MTQKRRDEHSTEFGNWIREQPEIDSGLGYVATNIDYVWRNYKTGEWMFLEEKRHGSQPRRYQRDIYVLLHQLARADPKYRGFHLLVFQQTCPDDGEMTLDGWPISHDELIEFLRDFRTPQEIGEHL